MNETIDSPSRSTPPENNHFDIDKSIYELLSQYPLLANIKHPEWWQIIKRSQLLCLDEKKMLMQASQPCQKFIFILDGRVRVFQHAEDGREVTLYHSDPGDVCVMSLSSLLHSKPFKANAESDTPVKLLALSSSDFSLAMSVSEIFRQWVLTSVTDSFCDVLETFHGTVFKRLEMRMACLLGQLFERAQADVLQITHQELAQELGSTREVVSRVLKHLEKQGCIALSRGKIYVANEQKLSFS